MTNDSKKLNNIKRSDIYQLKKNEFTTINNWPVGDIIVQRYSKIFFEWYWKRKFFILTDSHLIISSKYYYKKKKYKLKKLKINGIMSENDLIFFNICNKKNNKKILSLTSSNYTGLLWLHTCITNKLKLFN